MRALIDMIAVERTMRAHMVVTTGAKTYHEAIYSTAQDEETEGMPEPVQTGVVIRVEISQQIHQTQCSGCKIVGPFKTVSGFREQHGIKYHETCKQQKDGYEPVRILDEAR